MGLKEKERERKNWRGEEEAKKETNEKRTT